MKKIPIMLIALMVISVGFLSGCTDDSSSSTKDRISKPQMLLSEEEYKNICDDISSYEIDKGDKVVIVGEILKITSYGTRYDIFDIYSDTIFEPHTSLYVVTDENHSFKKGDDIRIWGECIDFYPFEPENAIFWYNEPLIWVFFITKRYLPLGSISDETYLKLYEMIGLKNPTYDEMVQFVSTDNTDKNIYSDTFVCPNFTLYMINNARKKGFIADEVAIYQTEKESFGLNETDDMMPSHAIVSFDTSDKGLYFVEPQSDTIITKDEFEQMQNDGNYPYVEDFVFDHYKITFGMRMYFLYNWEDYSWDDEQALWTFTIDDNSYTIEDL